MDRLRFYAMKYVIVNKIEAREYTKGLAKINYDNERTRITYKLHIHIMWLLQLIFFLLIFMLPPSVKAATGGKLMSTLYPTFFTGDLFAETSSELLNGGLSANKNHTGFMSIPLSINCRNREDS